MILKMKEIGVPSTQCNLELSFTVKISRISCKEHGILTIDVSWAGKYSRFTALFERLAIDILLATQNQTKAKDLLKLSWNEIHLIQSRAVKRGLERRKSIQIETIGVDEKSFRSGQSYLTVLYNLELRSVIDVEPNREEESLKRLLKSIFPQDKEKLKVVVMDMWKAYKNTVQEILPQADIVFDKFSYPCTSV